MAYRTAEQAARDKAAGIKTISVSEAKKIEREKSRPSNSSKKRTAVDIEESRLRALKPGTEAYQKSLDRLKSLKGEDVPDRYKVSTPKEKFEVRRDKDIKEQQEQEKQEQQQERLTRQQKFEKRIKGQELRSILKDKSAQKVVEETAVSKKPLPKTREQIKKEFKQYDANVSVVLPATEEESKALKKESNVFSQFKTSFKAGLAFDTEAIRRAKDDPSMSPTEGLGVTVGSVVPAVVSYGLGKGFTYASAYLRSLGPVARASTRAGEIVLGAGFAAQTATEYATSDDYLVTTAKITRDVGPFAIGAASVKVKPEAFARRRFLKAQEKKLDIFEPTKEFSVKTKESFKPSEIRVDVVKGKIEPVVETVKVTEKAPGYDVPTKLRRPGELKPDIVVKPEVDVFLKLPKERQLTLTETTKFDPFTKIERAQFTPEKLGIREPTFIEKAQVDPAQLKLQTEVVPQRAKRLIRMQEPLGPSPDAPINFRRTQFDLSQTRFNVAGFESQPISTFATKEIAAFIPRPTRSSRFQIPKLTIGGKRGQASLQFQRMFETSRGTLRQSQVKKPVTEIIRSKPVISTGFKPALRTVSVLDLNLGQFQKTEPKVSQVSKLENDFSLVQLLKISQNQGVDIRQAQKQKVVQTQVSDQFVVSDGQRLNQTRAKQIVQQPTTKSTLIILTTKPSKTSRGGRLPSFSIKPRPTKKTFGYDVYKQENGKQTKINRVPLGKENAKSLLARNLDTTKAYEGRIKKTKQKIVKQPVNPYFSNNRNKFIQTGNKISEKRRYRKDNPFEL